MEDDKLDENWKYAVWFSCISGIVSSVCIGLMIIHLWYHRYERQKGQGAIPKNLLILTLLMLISYWICTMSYGLFRSNVILISLHRAMSYNHQQSIQFCRIVNFVGVTALAFGKFFMYQHFLLRLHIAFQGSTFEYSAKLLWGLSLSIGIMTLMLLGAFVQGGWDNVIHASIENSPSLLYCTFKKFPDKQKYTMVTAYLLDLVGALTILLMFILRLRKLVKIEKEMYKGQREPSNDSKGRHFLKRLRTYYHSTTRLPSVNSIDPDTISKLMQERKAQRMQAETQNFLETEIEHGQIEVMESESQHNTNIKPTLKQVANEALTSSMLNHHIHKPHQSRDLELAYLARSNTSLRIEIPDGKTEDTGTYDNSLADEVIKHQTTSDLIHTQPKLWIPHNSGWSISPNGNQSVEGMAPTTTITTTATAAAVAAATVTTTTTTQSITPTQTHRPIMKRPPILQTTNSRGYPSTPTSQKGAGTSNDDGGILTPSKTMTSKHWGKSHSMSVRTVSHTISQSEKYFYTQLRSVIRKQAILVSLGLIISAVVFVAGSIVQEFGQAMPLDNVLHCFCVWLMFRFSQNLCNKYYQLICVQPCQRIKYGVQQTHDPNNELDAEEHILCFCCYCCYPSRDRNMIVRFAEEQKEKEKEGNEEEEEEEEEWKNKEKVEDESSLGTRTIDKSSVSNLHTNTTLPIVSHLNFRHRLSKVSEENNSIHPEDMSQELRQNILTLNLDHPQTVDEEDEEPEELIWSSPNSAHQINYNNSNRKEKNIGDYGYDYDENEEDDDDDDDDDDEDDEDEDEIDENEKETTKLVIKSMPIISNTDASLRHHTYTLMNVTQQPLEKTQDKDTRQSHTPVDSSLGDVLNASQQTSDTYLYMNEEPLSAPALLQKISNGYKNEKHTEEQEEEEEEKGRKNRENNHSSEKPLAIRYKSSNAIYGHNDDLATHSKTNPHKPVINPYSKSNDSILSTVAKKGKVRKIKLAQIKKKLKDIALSTIHHSTATTKTKISKPPEDKFITNEILNPSSNSLTPRSIQSADDCLPMKDRTKKSRKNDMSYIHPTIIKKTTLHPIVISPNVSLPNPNPNPNRSSLYNKHNPIDNEQKIEPIIHSPISNKPLISTFNSNIKIQTDHIKNSSLSSLDFKYEHTIPNVFQFDDQSINNSLYQSQRHSISDSKDTKIDHHFWPKTTHIPIEPEVNVKYTTNGRSFTDSTHL